MRPGRISTSSSSRPTSYPQDEQWFQSFAGTAFQWADDATGARGAAEPPLSSTSSARRTRTRPQAAYGSSFGLFQADEEQECSSSQPLLLRGVVATFTGLLIAGGTLTLAADRAAPQRPTLVPVAASPKTLTVPQVTGQAYVFAKGILQDGGFAWQVSGPVQGYAGNTVADQQPAAGSVVVDTGAPTITLTLARNKGFAERGGPDNTAPYAGTTVLLPANSAASSTAPARAPSVRLG